MGERNNTYGKVARLFLFGAVVGGLMAIVFGRRTLTNPVARGPSLPRPADELP